MGKCAGCMGKCAGAMKPGLYKGVALTSFTSNTWAQVKDNFSSEQREQMNRDFLAAKKKVKVA